MDKSNPNIPHPLYTKHKEQLDLVNDVYDGIDTAKEYLLQYTEETSTDYQARQNNSELDNFVFRTVEDAKNIIFRKPIDISGIKNKELLVFSEKIDYSRTLNQFAKDVLVARIRDGFTFILADSVAYDESTVKTKADLMAINARPYLVHILRKDVISWKINKFGEYTQIVFREYVDLENEYAITTEERIKVWNNDGTVEVWDKEKMIYSMNTGFKGIPIVKIGDNDVPSLYGMAKINIAHMNRNSELSTYVRIGGAPFIAAFGNLGDNAPKTLSINKGVKFDSRQDSDIKWVEMTGSNYDIIEKRIKYHEEQMQRIAINFTSGIQNKTALQVSKESIVGESKATNYAEELEDGLNTALEYMNKYKTQGTTYGTNTVSVNKDYDSSILTPDLIASYRLDYTSGIISWERYIKILEDGEYFKPMTDQEREAEKARLRDEGK